MQKSSEYCEVSIMEYEKIRITKDGAVSKYGRYRKIKNYYFYRDINCGKCENDKYNVYKYSFSIEFDSNVDMIQIDDLLREIRYITFISSTPQKEVNLIEKYDTNITDEKSVLFHDMRRNFIEICEYISIESDNINIFFIGFSLYKNFVHFTIKTFDFSMLRVISNYIIDHFNKNHCNIVRNTNMNWLTINNLLKFKNNNNILVDENEKNKLLECSLKYEDIMNYALSKIMSDGYLTIDDMRKKINGKASIDSLKQMKILFKEYLKLNIQNKFVYLHEELANNYHVEKVKNSIFSFSPRLLQYFDLSWYEDYTYECVSKSLRKYKIELLDISRNNVYNFTDLDEDYDIEFDLILLLKKDNIEKIVAIECKRTLSKKEIKKV